MNNDNEAMETEIGEAEAAAAAQRLYVSGRGPVYVASYNVYRVR